MIFSRLFGKKNQDKNKAKKVNKSPSSSQKQSNEKNFSEKKTQNVFHLNDDARKQWLNEFDSLTDNAKRAEKIANLSDLKLLSQAQAKLKFSEQETKQLESKAENLLINLKDIDDDLRAISLPLINHSQSVNIKRRIIRLYADTEQMLDNAIDNNEQKIVAAIAAWSTNAEQRQKAIKQISEGDQLRMVIKHGNDKSVTALAKETLQIAKETEKNKRHAHEQIDDILVTMAKLSSTDADVVTSGRVKLLKKRWQDIKQRFVSDEDRQKMTSYVENIDQKIAAFDEKELEKKQKQMTLESQQVLIKNLCHRTLNITVPEKTLQEKPDLDTSDQETLSDYDQIDTNSLGEHKNGESKAKSFANFCKEIDQQWQVLMDSKLADNKLAEDFAMFRQYTKQMQRCINGFYEQSQNSQSPVASRTETDDSDADVAKTAKENPKKDQFSLIEQRQNRLKRIDKDVKKLSELPQKIKQKDYLQSLSGESFTFISEYHNAVNQVNKNHRELRKKLNDKARYVDGKIVALKSQIRQKNLLKSNKLYHYIQNNINDLQGHFKKKAEDKLSLVFDDLRALRGLHDFVTLPKKEQLCQEMEALSMNSDKDMSVEARQDEIKKIQNHWRSIMSHDAEADDVMWDRFHLASDKAYEPIKHHFQELDQLRHDNLIKRQKICDEIRHYIDTTDWQRPDWKEISLAQKKRLNQWHDAFPIFYSENRAVQKRFDKLMVELRTYLDKEREENIEIKYNLVMRAIALAEPFGYESKLKFTLSSATKPVEKEEGSTDDTESGSTEDNSELESLSNEETNELASSDSEAEPEPLIETEETIKDKELAAVEIDEVQLNKSIETYQLLQSQWKNVGIVFIGQDRKLWKEFSAIGDVIFGHQRQLRKNEKQKSNQEIGQIDKIIANMRKLTNADDEKLYGHQESLAELKSQAMELLADKDEKLQSAIERKIDNVIADFDTQLAGVGERKRLSQMKELRQLNKLLASAEDVLSQSNKIDEISLVDINSKISDIEDKNLIKALQGRIDSVNENKLYQGDINADDIGKNLKSIIIDLEVKLGLPTPDSDKSQRMEYQLKLLAKGVSNIQGKSEKQQYVSNKELEYYQYRAIKNHQYQQRLDAIIDSVK